MKDNLTPGMDKAGRKALELRNTVSLLEAELERLRLAGETASPQSGPECQYRADPCVGEAA